MRQISMIIIAVAAAVIGSAWAVWRRAGRDATDAAQGAAKAKIALRALRWRFLGVTAAGAAVLWIIGGGDLELPAIPRGGSGGGSPAPDRSCIRYTETSETGDRLTITRTGGRVSWQLQRGPSSRPGAAPAYAVTVFVAGTRVHRATGTVPPAGAITVPPGPPGRRLSMEISARDPSLLMHAACLL